MGIFHGFLVKRTAPIPGPVKKSAQQRELLFSGTTDGTSSTIQPCVLMEMSKDTHTSMEKAELLAWVRPCPTFPSSPSNPLPNWPTDALRKTGSSIWRR